MRTGTFFVMLLTGFAAATPVEKAVAEGRAIEEKRVSPLAANIYNTYQARKK